MGLLAGVVLVSGLVASAAVVCPRGGCFCPGLPCATQGGHKKRVNNG